MINTFEHLITNIKYVVANDLVGDMRFDGIWYTSHTGMGLSYIAELEGIVFSTEHNGERFLSVEETVYWDFDGVTPELSTVALEYFIDIDDIGDTDNTLEVVSESKAHLLML
jgi:hypothetical protein